MMENDQLQRVIDDLESALRDKESFNGAITYQETKIIFQALGLDEDLIDSGASVFHAVFYAILTQAQKTNQLEARLEELEKYTHTHPA